MSHVVKSISLRDICVHPLAMSTVVDQIDIQPEEGIVLREMPIPAHGFLQVLVLFPHSMSKNLPELDTKA